MVSQGSLPPGGLESSSFRMELEFFFACGASVTYLQQAGELSRLVRRD